MGNLKEALNHAKTSINLNPDNEEANKLLADLEK
jgi:hypothetical protein